MLGMVLKTPRHPLVAEALPDPEPGPGELRLRIRACGVCRTDLHIADGELEPRRAGVIPGHEIVGVVDAIGPGVTGVTLGERRGAPWLGGACGTCRYCREGRENLCDAPEFTGWTRDGGYAEAVVARADFTFPLPEGLSDVDAAPLLCAGLIGFRAWRMACEGGGVQRLGLYGFGAAAHLLAQLAIHEGQAVYAFTRHGDEPAQRLARELGCVWAGPSEARPPDELDAAILFAPVGDLVPLALAAVRKGGSVVCGGIHMSDIPRFAYDLLWGERRLVSVANLTRQDAIDYLPRAVADGVRAHVTAYPLAEANAALDDLRAGRVVGAAVLTP
ncbi:MAG: zinc-dependent alcohol dehydrogenase family protein [Phenylobacterium sp.]|uniref:zinc-dependent alcohol dehydrogenase family protein n=1 Tax=Phenylobacterium sp. TaxID=1871053 RepID=UPI001A632401|nr:zinc-dependent alcohol dehydrogenase family protein [Phenylobacterium sp.]MBL8770075.1 zinc-dependent alcohol dehydrogenase family protein [Phenylobacterium sp.]